MADLALAGVVKLFAFARAWSAICAGQGHFLAPRARGHNIHGLSGRYSGAAICWAARTEPVKLPEARMARPGP
jgi:hypothetical protein